MPMSEDSTYCMGRGRKKQIILHILSNSRQGAMQRVTSTFRNNSHLQLSVNIHTFYEILLYRCQIIGFYGCFQINYCFCLKLDIPKQYIAKKIEPRGLICMSFHERNKKKLRITPPLLTQQSPAPKRALLATTRVRPLRTTLCVALTSPDIPRRHQRNRLVFLQKVYP